MTILTCIAIWCAVSVALGLLLGAILKEFGCLLDRRDGYMNLKYNKPLIAIIDEDPEICDAISRLVCSDGMEAQTFTSSREFVELIESTRSFRPDCVILDVHIRDISGLEVQLKLSWRRAGTPVIFVTAAHEGWVYEEAVAAGAAAFFMKPFDGDALLAAIRMTIGRRRNS